MLHPLPSPGIHPNPSHPIPFHPTQSHPIPCRPIPKKAVEEAKKEKEAAEKAKKMKAEEAKKEKEAAEKVKKAAEEAKKEKESEEKAKQKAAEEAKKDEAAKKNVVEEAKKKEAKKEEAAAKKKNAEEAKKAKKEHDVVAAQNKLAEEAALKPAAEEDAVVATKTKQEITALVSALAPHFNLPADKAALLIAQGVTSTNALAALPPLEIRRHTTLTLVDCKTVVVAAQMVVKEQAAKAKAEAEAPVRSKVDSGLADLLVGHDLLLKVGPQLINEGVTTLADLNSCSAEELQEIGVEAHDALKLKAGPALVPQSSGQPYTSMAKAREAFSNSSYRALYNAEKRKLLVPGQVQQAVEYRLSADLLDSVSDVVKEYAKEKEKEGIASPDLMMRVGAFIGKLLDVMQKSPTPELKAIRGWSSQEKLEVNDHFQCEFCSILNQVRRVSVHVVLRNGEVGAKVLVGAKVVLRVVLRSYMK